MICNKCGSAVPDGNVFCGQCGNPLPSPEQPSQSQDAPSRRRAKPAEKPVEVKTEKERFFKSPGKGSKGFAALMTALMVFPATFCIALDTAISRSDGWSLYVVGALIVAWVVIVLPILDVTPAPVTALICFFAIVGYIFFVAGRLGKMENIYEVGLPLMVLFALFIAVDSALMGSGKLKGLHAFSVIALQSAIYFVVIESVWDNHMRGEVDLDWSLIYGCFFVSAIALAEAINYVIKINKKK